MEIEQEKVLTPGKENDFVGLMEADDVGPAGHVAPDSQHVLVEGLELAVAEVRVVGQVPLPPAVVEGPVVALPRKVDPLRMAELVAHEVQVPFTPNRECYQPDHLVQGHASIHCQGFRGLEAHVRVDLAVEQPH
jgi:hypothetical protein